MTFYAELINVKTITKVYTKGGETNENEKSIEYYSRRGYIS